MSTQPTSDNASVQRIVVGVDGSPDGLRAVRYGCGWAFRNPDAVLELVHVVDDAVLAGAWGIAYDPSVLVRASEQATEEALEVTRAAGLDDSRVRTTVLNGNPASALAAHSEGALVLVVGRRAMSGLERMFVGSTSASVAGSATCPVLVISQATTPGLTGDKGRIVVGVDADRHSGHTLRWALDEARARTAAGNPTSLHVVHVLAPAPGGMFDPAPIGLADSLREAAEEGVRGLVDSVTAGQDDIAIDTEVTAGGAVDVLVQLSQQADLVVLGAQPARGIQLPGGTMRGVLAHAVSPVALVP